MFLYSLYHYILKAFNTSFFVEITYIFKQILKVNYLIKYNY